MDWTDLSHPPGFHSFLHFFFILDVIIKNLCFRANFLVVPILIIIFAIEYIQFIYVLKNMETLNRMPWAAQNAVFQRLAEVAEVSKLSKEERLQYDHALKRYRDTLNAMTGAEMKGRAEGAIQIARKLKAMNTMSVD